MSVTQQPRCGDGNRGSKSGGSLQRTASSVSPGTGANVKDGIRATFTRVLAAAVLATVGLGVGDSLGALRRHDQLRWVVVGSAVGFACSE